MKKIIHIIIFFSFVIISAKEDSKPLLRVFPIYRVEECEWAIRFDICLKCVKQKEQYAQRIKFLSTGPYREHGCYTDQKGFFLLD